MTAKRQCAARAWGGAPLCDRARRHAGQHAATIDGRTFRWGGSGPTQREEERTAGQVLLRLTPTIRDALRELAEREGCTRSQLVSRLVLAALAR